MYTSLGSLKLKLEREALKRAIGQGHTNPPRPLGGQVMSDRLLAVILFAVALGGPRPVILVVAVVLIWKAWVWLLRRHPLIAIAIADSSAACSAAGDANDGYCRPSQFAIHEASFVLACVRSRSTRLRAS